MSTGSRPQGTLAAWRDRVIVRMLDHTPHNPALGLARTLIAVGTLIALVSTPVQHLFYVSPPRPDGRLCEGVLGSAGLFCLAPLDQLEAARWAAVAILVVVASGFAPRWTAVPHWWVSFSVYSSSNAMDGGDQVAAVLTLLLLPLCLTDRRRWHWTTDTGAGRRSPGLRVANGFVLLLLWVQVCVIYFHASVGKLAVVQWRDGTALWYWTMFPTFAVPEPLYAPMSWLLSHGVVVASLTWGTLALEFFLACCLFAGPMLRRLGLGLGVALHLGIAVLMGLPGFSTIMFGALVLYLLRPGDPLPEALTRRMSRRSGGDTGAKEAKTSQAGADAARGPVPDPDPVPAD